MASKEHLKVNKIEKDLGYHSEKKISVISNFTKGKVYKTVIKLQRNMLAEIEAIVQHFDTIARTDEAKPLATSKVLITKH